MKAKEKIKQILESTFAYNVENDRVASEINSLYANQQPKIQSAEEFLKSTSPNEQYGIRAELKKHNLLKMVEGIMKKYAQQFNQKGVTVEDILLSKFYVHLTEQNRIVDKYTK